MAVFFDQAQHGFLHQIQRIIPVTDRQLRHAQCAAFDSRQKAVHSPGLFQNLFLTLG
jgi:hypothetical protein